MLGQKKFAAPLVSHQGALPARQELPVPSLAVPAGFRGKPLQLLPQWLTQLPYSDPPVEAGQK